MDAAEPLSQGYSARLLRPTHGVPTHNKRLQNIEHGLATRDKIRIINYLQAKPPRRTPSPVSPQFQCLAEELLSSDMGEVKDQSLTTEANTSEDTISMSQKNGYSLSKSLSDTSTTETTSEGITLTPPQKFRFSIAKSPSDNPIGKRTQKAITKTANARRDWQNSRRPGLTSPTFSESSFSSSDERSEPKQEVNDGTNYDAEHVAESDTKSEESTGQDLTTQEKANQKSVSNISPTVGFSARKLGSKVPVFKESIPPPTLPQTRSQSNPLISPVPSSSYTASIRSSTSPVSISSRRSPPPEPTSVTDKPPSPVRGFSARNPPPGLQPRPKLFSETSTDVTSPTQSSVAKHPPPGFHARQPPPGFAEASMVEAPPGFGHKETSPSLLAPKESSPATTRGSSPSAKDSMSSSTIDKKVTFQIKTDDDKEATLLNQSNSVARFARQQIHPYTTPPATSGTTPERAKRTLASAKAEVEAIKRAHMAATNMIPPHVRKLEAALERIGAKHSMQAKVNHNDVDKNQYNIYNRNNNALFNDEEEETAVPVKVKIATWRAIDVNYRFLVSNNQMQFAFGVSNLCHLLKTHGKEMEEHNKDGMNKIFVSIRNIILDHSKKISHRVELLEVLELRAKKWKGSKITEVNSAKGGSNSVASDSGDGRGSVSQTTLRTDDGANNNLQKEGVSAQHDLPSHKNHRRLGRNFSGPARLQTEQRYQLTPQEDEVRHQRGSMSPQEVASPKEFNEGGRSRHSSLETKKHSRKYSREFLLRCYDSPYTKEIPIMLHYTFMNSDTGFIVDRNYEDPRELIRVTSLPPHLKSIEESYGHARSRRLHSWPGPSFSPIPESSQESLPSSPGLLGAAPPEFMAQNKDFHQKDHKWGSTEVNRRTISRPWNLGSGPPTLPPRSPSPGASCATSLEEARLKAGLFNLSVS